MNSLQQKDNEMNYLSFFQKYGFIFSREKNPKQLLCIAMQLKGRGGNSKKRVDKIAIDSFQQIKMGKKANPRDTANDDSRKEFLDSSLFFYEYLNNSLNYILSGKTDLDHALHFDLSALKKISSSGPLEENVHFVERVKSMKTRCDPSIYNKQVQEYGEFINYEISRTHTQQIAGMQAQLAEQFDIILKLKRVKKRLKLADDKLTLYQIDQMNKQINEEILTEIVQQHTQTRPCDIEENLDENKLFREMFNIQESLIIKKEEKVEIKKPKQRGPKRRNDDYYFNNQKQQTAFDQTAVQNEKIKREQQIEKTPFRFYPAAKQPVTTAPTPSQPFQIEKAYPSQPLPQPQPQIQPLPQPTVPPQIFNMQYLPPTLPTHAQPIRRPIENIEPKIPPNWSQPFTIAPAPPPTTKINPIQEKIQEELKAKKQLQRLQNTKIQQEIKSATIASVLDANKSSSAPQKVKRKQKKIQKDEKQDRQVRKRGPKPQLNKEKQPERQKRQYNKKKGVQSHLTQVPQVSQIITPPVIIYERKPTINICREIGIQADTNQDLQNFKVLTPRPHSFFQQSFAQQTTQIPQPQPQPQLHPQPQPQYLPPQASQHPQQAFIFQPIRQGPVPTFNPPAPVYAPAPISLPANLPPVERQDLQRQDGIQMRRLSQSRSYQVPIRKESDAQDRKIQDSDDISRYLA